MKLSDLPDTAYWRTFQGSFSSLLQWEDMSALWAYLKTSPEGWFVFDTLQQPPLEPNRSAGLSGLLDDVEGFTRKRHKHEYCGFIYVDKLNTPTLIKIFDPKNMGSSCGCSGELILPRWLISRIPPNALPVLIEKKKKGLLNWLNTCLQAVQQN